MDPARTRLRSAATELHEFLSLLEAIEGLAEATATTAEELPPGLAGPVANLVGFADPARLHRLGYQVAVVFGYAAFERFVRDLVVFVAQAMTTLCTGYGALPRNVREQHLRLTLKIASFNAERSLIDEQSLAPMLTRLLSCLNGTQPYQLNDEVFADHQANFRTGVVRETLRRVGVEVAEDRTTPQINALLENELNGLYARTATAIDDLADRRNQAAHGDEIELLDKATLRAVVNLVVYYADALAEDAFSHLARVLLAQAGTEIGLVEHTWAHPDTGDRTICRIAPSNDLAIDQPIIVLGREPRLTAVHSIELNGQKLELAQPVNGHHGIDVGIVAHNGERIFAIPQEGVELLEGLVSDA